MKYQSKDLGQFPYQIKYATEHYTSPGIDIYDFDNIILCGLGGSGIAGRIIKSYFFSISALPVEVISDYLLPKYAGSKTLAIMCSYSGNTEETLAMYAEAKAAGAGIIVIATGGKLAELAAADGYTFYKALSGFQPRMALGYSLTYLMLLFSELFGKANTSAELNAAATKLEDEAHYLQKGKALLDLIDKPLPAKFVVVSDYFTNPIGLRFCQQLQENAKTEAFLHELPECNHNVIETYYGKLDSVFIFLNSHIQPRTTLRFGFLKEVLENEGNKVMEISVDPSGILPVLESIYTLDWLSLLIADYKEVNSIQIKNINALKEFLGKN